MSTRVTVPVLWLVGAMGTGKSDTSYHLFSRLWRRGTSVARLDLDDLGMCHPTPADDPDNHRVKAEALAAAWSVFADRGADCLVVSGGVNTAAEVALHRARIPTATWTVCRLRIGAAEREVRTTRRGALLGMSADDVASAVEAGIADEATLEAQPITDLVLDTDGLDQQQVVDLVLARTGWPDAEPG